jgi:lysophospholipase L1-like esterase
VIDFDRAVRDPRIPTQLFPDYSSDGIHMSDAGYLTMANAIDLRLFR